MRRYRIFTATPKDENYSYTLLEMAAFAESRGFSDREFDNLANMSTTGSKSVMYFFTTKIKREK